MCWAVGDHKDGVGLTDHPVCDLYLSSLPVSHSCSHSSHTKSSVVWVVQLPVRGNRSNFFCIPYMFWMCSYWYARHQSVSQQWQVRDFGLTCIPPPFCGNYLPRHQSTAGKPAPHLMCSISSAGRCECHPKLVLFCLRSPCMFSPSVEKTGEEKSLKC